ncbi:MAG: hypothetical protein RI911_199 [Candidatus Parcubacteria bacterium]|jgi:hypothetical protein
MSWAGRKRFLYAFGVAAFLFMLALPVIYSLLSQPATCFDGIQNQDETAIDLGGPCALRDPGSLKPVSVLWTRSFKLLPGIYSAIAYLENPNHDTGSEFIRYTISMYDSRGILVAERHGNVFLPPQAIVPIFESNIQTGNRIPVRATTVLEPGADWYRMKKFSGDMEVRDQENIDMDSRPRVRADVHNTGFEYLRSIPVVATVFDEAGNAVGGSKTVIDDLPPGDSAEVVFTWPAPFTSYVSRVDIRPISNPDIGRRL